MSDRSALSQRDLKAYKIAYQEFEESLLVSNDRAGSHLMLGNFAEINSLNPTPPTSRQSALQAAKTHYENAIRVEPKQAGARKNLAALLEQNLQRELQATAPNAAEIEATKATIDQLRADELQLLRRDAGLLPNNAELQYQLGLAEYLAGNSDAAVDRLQRAAELDPSGQRYALAWAMMLDQAGDRKAAIEALSDLLERFPGDPEGLQLLRSWQ
jgi:tetratricopeptide (TPR) repeat protein